MTVLDRLKCLIFGHPENTLIMRIGTLHGRRHVYCRCTRCGYNVGEATELCEDPDDMEDPKS